jgi:hypothetical protein
MTLPSRMVLRGGWGISYFPANIQSPSHLKNPPFISNYGPVSSNVTAGGAPTLLLKNGLPVLKENDPLNPPGNVIGTDLNFKSNRAQQFNVMLEKEMAGNVVSAGYIGSRGSDLSVQVNFNLAPAGPGNVNQRRPFTPIFPNMSGANNLVNVGESTYDAFQVVFQRRQRAGLTFNTHYTYASAQSYGPSPWDINVYEWGDTQLDIRHRWVLSLNYEIPWGSSLTGLSKGFLYGWQVNTAAFWQSGIPFTVTNSPARMNTGGSDRPNLIGDPELPESQRTVQRWFNTDAFALQPQFTAGNIGPSLMHGPPTRRMDLSVFKSLPVGGSRQLQVRIEIYNVFAVDNFANPESAFGSSSFGTITSTGNSIPRQMQFGVKYLF